MKRTLGLDLGTNSVGWAVLDVPETEDEVGAVLAMGSRIFEAGAEVKGATVTTKARERRTKRMMRRQIQRRASRRRLLRVELERIGMLPSGQAAFDVLMDRDPNELLRQAVGGGQLELVEIGRVIYWISSKRGFLSLRAGGGKALEDAEEGDFVPSRYRLSQFSRATGDRVVQGQEDVLVDFLRSQSDFHPALITDKFIFGDRGKMNYPVRPIARESYRSTGTPLAEFGIHGLVFFQRKVYWHASTIEKCSLDEGSGERAARGERVSQDFAIWNTIVNLRVGADQRALTEPERKKLHKLLSSQKETAFSKVRKLLAIGDEEPINFERGEKEKLAGNATDAMLSKALGKSWVNLAEGDKDDLVYWLLGSATDDQMRNQLAKGFGFDETEVEAVLKVTLPSGRMAYSRKTLARLLVFLPEATDLRAAIEEAGYATPEEARAGKTLDLDKVTNPLVRAALVQVGKVTRALDKRFARPGDATFDVVRIELSRDVSNSAKQRKQITKGQRKNEADRELAKKDIEEFAPGAENSRDAIRRARLWREQKESCLYCGKPISKIKLFTNEIQVEHILPRALTLDDSMANVAVVHSVENLDKGDRTVVEWKGEAFAAAVADRARSWGFRSGKVNKITREHVDPDHIPASLLVQTGYINSLARDYVAQQPGLTNSVEVSRGRLTRALLYRLGLHKSKYDHRRHAQDAAMIALTTTSLAQRLAKQYKAFRDYGKEREDEYGGWEPWLGLRAELEAVYEEILVSHAPKRKVSGQLHEETYYGKVTSPYSEGKDVYARRRPVADISKKSRLQEVADPAVREALANDLRTRGIDPDSAGAFKFDLANPPKMPDGQEIKKVRCHLNKPGNKILRPATQPRTGVALSNNHVAYVYKNTETEVWRIKIVTRLDAFRSRGVDETASRAAHANEGEEFVYSLCTGDTLEFADPGVMPRFCYVTGLDEEQRRLTVKDLTESRGEATVKARVTAQGSIGLKGLGATKVVILPDGQVRRAND